MESTGCAWGLLWSGMSKRSWRSCVASGAHEIGNIPGDYARPNICDTGDMIGYNMDRSWWISYVRLPRVTLPVSLAIFYFL